MSQTTFQNARATVEGHDLIIRIDLSQSLGRSKSGKSDLIATSGGNKPLNGISGLQSRFQDVRVGFTVYRPVQA